MIKYQIANGMVSDKEKTDHNTEMGNMTRSKFPYCFLKPPTTTLVGSGETVMLPEYAKMIDWEVELAVIIGQKTHRVKMLVLG